MAKRKILAIIIALTMSGLLSACSSTTNSREKEEQFEPFVIVGEEYINEKGLYQYVMYDPDTKVMYTIINGNCMTVLYNADGTLKLYSPEEEND